MHLGTVMLLSANLNIIYKLYRSINVFIHPLSPKYLTESIAIYWIFKSFINKTNTFVRY